MTGFKTGGDEIVRLENVVKTYGRGRARVTALDSVSVGFRRGSFTAVMGPSGSGKSTCLHCAAALDRPSSGSVKLDGIELTTMSERKLTRLRRDRIGFVFQSYNLLPSLSVFENVALPLRLAGRRVRRRTVSEVLEQVGMGEYRRSLPGELSGGQQQRAAIARAMITDPAVVYGDEPTGALDTGSAREVLGLLRSAVADRGQTVVIVTHDPVAASYADRVVFLTDGRLAAELFSPTVQDVSNQMTRFAAWREGAQPGLVQVRS